MIILLIDSGEVKAVWEGKEIVSKRIFVWIE